MSVENLELVIRPVAYEISGELQDEILTNARLARVLAMNGKSWAGWSRLAPGARCRNQRDDGQVEVLAATQ
jgi:hypothetical protein